VAAEPDAEGPNIEELTKLYEPLVRRSFTRQASAIYDHVTRYAGQDDAELRPPDLFVRAFYEGRWDAIRDALKPPLPESIAQGIYNKMLVDLTGRNVPVLTLDDFLGLADACPGEPNSGQIQKLGPLLRIAVPKQQELWLRKALEKGTRWLGADEGKRLATGRVLLHADFDGLALEYLPSLLEANKLEDAGIRAEIMQFLASQEKLQEHQQTQVGALWKQNADVLGDPTADSGRQQQAVDRLADLMEKAPEEALRPLLAAMVQRDPDHVLKLASTFGRRAPINSYTRDFRPRTSALTAQKCLLECVAEEAELDKPPWSHVAAVMADRWIQEAEHTIRSRPPEDVLSPDKLAKSPHVLPADVLDAVPEAEWIEALPQSVRERIDLCVSQVVLASDRYEEAVERIVELAGRNPAAGIELAEQYLKYWAIRHNPQVPEWIRQRLGLAEGAQIIVTPLMMQRNVDSMAEMMDAFRRHKINPRDAELLVNAFDVCYSDAEVYRRADVEKVFGPIGDMPEDVFSRLIRKMTDSLATRWRSMEVQEAAGARRDRQQTLDMVRRGYGVAVEMIDRRLEQHPDAWRVTAMAGTLASDWGTFEYFQELVTSDGTQRMQVYQEKGQEAEARFAKAAEIYARQVPQFTPGSYSIDVYLAWFHGLLGIGGNGNLNLSKSLDRAALGRLRDVIRALPKEAATAHVNLFAKHVNARLEDTENPLHEELKYKYLAGSLVIVKESPFSFQAQSKVDYYDELLEETRLTTRVDGPNEVPRDRHFGIILSIQHTEAMGRMADFGAYLVNERPRAGAPARPGQPATAVFRMSDVQGRRDQLELNLTEALAPFFEIASITFSPKDVRSRAIEKPGWEETVLAYLHVKVKDASVDKIPQIQLDLEFLDLTGPVTIAAESSETMIKVDAEPDAPRPFFQAEVTQTLDTRRMESSGEILLEVEATGCGLVPELDELLDLDTLPEELPVVRIDPQGDTLVRQINSWADSVHAVSERAWTVTFDAAALKEPGGPAEFPLPPPRAEDATATYRTYVDMDLGDLEDPVVALGDESAAGELAAWAASVPPWVVALVVVGGVFALGVVIALLVRLARRPRERPLRARDVFQMPAEIDPFVVVRLLRSMGSSELVTLGQRDRANLEEEITRIEASSFGGNGSGVADEELRNVARKWLRFAR